MIALKLEYSNYQVQITKSLATRQKLIDTLKSVSMCTSNKVKREVRCGIHIDFVCT